MKQLHEYETPELNALVKKQHLRMCSSSNDPADLFSEALSQMEDLATSLEQRLAAATEVLDEIYPRLLAGDFYEDYDRVTTMVGNIREIINPK